MIKKIIYLSGAMGCYDRYDSYPYTWRANFERIIKSAEEDSDYYKTFEIFDPTMYYDYHEPTHYTEKEIFRYEMRKVSESDVIVVNLKDIEKSVGTICEVVNAYNNNIPIIGFVNEFIGIKNIHPWIVEMCDRVEIGTNDNDAIEKAVDYILTYY